MPVNRIVRKGTLQSLFRQDNTSNFPLLFIQIHTKFFLLAIVTCLSDACTAPPGI